MNDVRSLFLLLVFMACTTPQQPARPGKAALAQWENWKTQRVEELISPDGFLNLAGLFWLDEGENAFGSDSGNALIFPPDFPPTTGVFRVENGNVTMKANTELLIDSMAVTEAVVFDPSTGKSPVVAWKDFRWFVIERAGNLGIRLKNLAHPLLSHPLDIPYFPYHPDWVVEADYVPYPIARKLHIENVFGHQFEMEISGQLRFAAGGQSFTLEPIDEGEKFFIIFSDGTSAIETYGSGRYLYAKRPKNGEKVILDFNTAYNPPCAFTDFATCFIPPPENRLDVRVEAGEKDFHPPHF